VSLGLRPRAPFCARDASSPKASNKRTNDEGEGGGGGAAPPVSTLRSHLMSLAPGGTGTARMARSARRKAELSCAGLGAARTARSALST